jgi:hypothetical protein
MRGGAAKKFTGERQKRTCKRGGARRPRGSWPDPHTVADTAIDDMDWSFAPLLVNVVCYSIANDEVEILEEGRQRKHRKTSSKHTTNPMYHI